MHPTTMTEPTAYVVGFIGIDRDDALTPTYCLGSDLNRAARSSAVNDSAHFQAES